jgi:hypothetical protein
MLSVQDVHALCTPYRALVSRVDDECLHVSVPLGRDEEEAVYGLKARLAHAGYQVICYKTGARPQLGVLGRLSLAETQEAQRATARYALAILTERLNLDDAAGRDVSREGDAISALGGLIDQLIG